jgi:hypothetical protein
MKPKVLLLCSVIASFAHAEVAQKRSVNSPLRLVDEARSNATVVSKLAATLAATLANDQARKQFDATPFSALTDKATFRGDHWQWQSTVGYGKGDLRATVSFKPDGSGSKVEIVALVNECCQ